jgi:hypothetical protein
MTGAGRGPSKGKRTVEHDAAKRAADKKARAAAAAADRQANLDKERTVEVVEHALRRVMVDLLALMDSSTGGPIMGKAEQHAALAKESGNLREELKRKREERAKALTPRVEFTKQDVDDALRPLLEELERVDPLEPTEKKLEAVRKQYEPRIIALQEVAQQRKLTEGESEELARLREGGARIAPAIKKAHKDLKERKEKASTARRRQEALADFEDPEKHLTEDDKENWWAKDGRRQWRKLRRRGKRAVARENAGLPADADRAPVQEAPIEPSSLAGSSDAQWERELNEQMEVAGLRAIEALCREKGAEAQRLREAGYSGSDSDDAGVDG